MNSLLNESKFRRFFRFSLGTLLVLITCVCCWFGGRIYGDREGLVGSLNKLPTWTNVYFVGDVTKLNARGDFKGAIEKIKQRCTAGVWEEEGGKSQLSPFPLNATIIVDTSYPIHKQISELLEQMRLEEFGPDYRVEVTISSPASQAVADAK